MTFKVIGLALVRALVHGAARFTLPHDLDHDVDAWPLAQRVSAAQLRGERR